MFYLRILLSALLSLRANFLRSGLAVLGVTIGIGTVIAAIATVEGSTKEVVESMQKVGSGVLWIKPGGMRVQGRHVESGRTLDMDDAEAVARSSQVSAVAPEIHGLAQVRSATDNRAAMIIGTTPEYAHILKYKATSGNFFSRAESVANKPVAVLGAKVAGHLFEQRQAAGDSIRIARVEFRVVGVMEEKGFIAGTLADLNVYIPITRARRLFNPRSLSQISVEVTDPQATDRVSRELGAALRRRHGLRVGEPDDFRIDTQEELLAQFTKVTRILQGVFFAISGISLVVGGIGIMNIMLVSVTERTREIGVRMAIGAQRWDILWQFLIESATICALGVPMGMGLGWAIAHVVESSLAPLVPHISEKTILLAVAVAIFTGILSGFYPAWRASRLDPVEALRYE